MGTCYFCGAAVGDDDYCFGCNEYVCEACGATFCVGRHSPECHAALDDDLANDDPE
jgi:hypothetical protein